MVGINPSAYKIFGKFRLQIGLMRRWDFVGIRPGIFPEIQVVRCDQQKIISNAPDAVRKQVSSHLSRPVTRSSKLALNLGNCRNLPAPIKDS